MGARVVVSTVVRRAAPNETSGYLRVVDLDDGEVLAVAPVPETPYRADDPNPRGGLRGVRGVGAHDDRLVVATSDRLFVLDAAWEVEREVSHPWMSGVHGIFVEPERIWVTSTAADLVLGFDWHGHLADAWCWREDRQLVRFLGFDDLPPLDESRDYRVPLAGAAAEDLAHVNGVARTSSGRLLVSFGQVLTSTGARREVARQRVMRAASQAPGARGLLAAARRRRGRARSRALTPAPPKQGSYAVVELEPAGGVLRTAAKARVVHKDEGTRVPNHDAIDLDGVLAYCDSNGSRLVLRERPSGTLRAAIGIPGDPPFARGLARLRERRFAVGSQRPAAVHVVDLDAGVVEKSVNLGGVPDETVFGVALLTDAFAPTPPGRALAASLAAGAGTRV